MSCQNGICVKTKVTGTACGGGDPVPCSNVQHCTADPADPTSTGTCQPRTAGGPCHVDIDCPNTEFCLAGTCTVRRAVGQSCADADLGCVPWTACDANGLCAVAGRPDFPCAPFGSPPFLTCSTGTCNATANGTLCVANATVGEACGGAAFCAPGTACDDLGTFTCLACPP